MICKTLNDNTKANNYIAKTTEMMTEQINLYLITTSSVAGTLETMPPTENLKILSVDELENNDLRFSDKQKICITSEASIDILLRRIDDDNRVNAIKRLKDKYLFREIIREIYPNYKFQLVKAEEIKNLTITEKSVIKPVKGFFGTAVRVIEPHTDFEKLSIELQNELEKNGAIFSDSVLSREEFIIEEFIKGEEFAVDMFYNANGDPCITNIYYHPIPNNLAYLHMIYYSSKAVFDKIYDKAKYFFTELNKILKVKNLAIHGEFKLNDIQVIPIELNAMRFGGMGLGSMLFHTIGENPYEYFIKDVEPNWKAIWEGREKDNYVFFLAYNALNKSVKDHKPNVAKLKQRFGKIFLEKLFNYQKEVAFGIYFLQETDENISNLLAIEFDDFFDKAN